MSEGYKALSPTFLSSMHLCVWTSKCSQSKQSGLLQHSFSLSGFCTHNFFMFLFFYFYGGCGFWYTDTPSSSLSFSIVKCGVSPGSDRPLSRGNFRASAVPSATRTQHRTECHHPCPKNWDYHIVKKKRKLFWKIRDRMGAGTKYHFVSFGSAGKFFWHIPHGIEIKRYFLTTIFFLNHCNFGSGHFQTPPENKDQ